MTTKVHGFKNHVVSNFMEKRYPYIEDKEQEWRDSKGVFRSAYSRVFQNLRTVLEAPGSSALEKREALLILNEMSNHQEQKVEMIEEGFVLVCEECMKSDDEELLYETLRLLGSLMSVKLGRDQLS